MLYFFSNMLEFSCYHNLRPFRTISVRFGQFRSNPVDRDTACQSSMKEDVNENTVLETT